MQYSIPGKLCGSQSGNGTDPWRVLLLAVVKRAVDDLNGETNSQHCVDPMEARIFLLDDAPALLEVLSLGDYVDRLLKLANGAGEPQGQLSFDYLLAA